MSGIPSPMHTCRRLPSPASVRARHRRPAMTGRPVGVSRVAQRPHNHVKRKGSICPTVLGTGLVPPGTATPSLRGPRQSLRPGPPRRLAPPSLPLLLQQAMARHRRPEPVRRPSTLPATSYSPATTSGGSLSGTWPRALGVPRRSHRSRSRALPGPPRRPQPPPSAFRGSGPVLPRREVNAPAVTMNSARDEREVPTAPGHYRAGYQRYIAGYRAGPLGISVGDRSGGRCSGYVRRQPPVSLPPPSRQARFEPPS